MTYKVLKDEFNKILINFIYECIDSKGATHLY